MLSEIHRAEHLEIPALLMHLTYDVFLVQKVRGATLLPVLFEIRYGRRVQVDSTLNHQFQKAPGCVI